MRNCKHTQLLNIGEFYCIAFHICFSGRQLKILCFLETKPIALSLQLISFFDDYLPALKAQVLLWFRGSQSL